MHNAFNAFVTVITYLVTTWCGLLILGGLCVYVSVALKRGVPLGWLGGLFLAALAVVLLKSCA